MTSLMKKLVVVGITFESSKRKEQLNLLLQRVTQIVSASNLFELEVEIVSYQNPISDMPLRNQNWSNGKKNLYEINSGIQMFAEYDKLLEVSTIQRLKRSLSRFRKKIKTITLLPSLFTDESSGVRQREMALTDKHLYALRVAAEKRADYLLVFEDDAVPHNGELETSLKYFVEKLNSISVPNFYLDLTAHFPSTEVFSGSNSLLVQAPDGWDETLFFANTTAAYAMDSICLQSILESIVNFPRLRWLSVDWALSRAAQKTGLISQIKCYTRSPGLFINSSLVTGDSQLKKY